MFRTIREVRLKNHIRELREIDSREERKAVETGFFSDGWESGIFEGAARLISLWPPSFWGVSWSEISSQGEAAFWPASFFRYVLVSWSWMNHRPKTRLGFLLILRQNPNPYYPWE